MKERLIELLNEVADNVINIPTDNFIESLAAHLLANGVIVPPCKVGDTVYVAYRHQIAPDYIIAEDISKIGIATKQFFGENTYDFNQFDKTVFLTKEEAEKALAERNKE